MSSGAAESQQPLVLYAEPEATQAASAPDRQAAPTTTRSLIDFIIESSGVAAAPALGQLDRFLGEPSTAQALQLWLGPCAGMTCEQLIRRLNRDVAQLDRLLNDQLNAILHHPAFQKLEGSWRGVSYLVERSDDEAERNIKIKLLNVTWRELERDFERAVEFDQSQLFRKVYEDEFGNPGGEPYSVMLGDYEVRPRPGPGYPHDDMAVLTSLAQVAAAAFCPFITSVGPEMFGLDDYGELEQKLNHARTLNQVEYVKWNALRKSEDARFLGLTLPRVLMRVPYEDDGTRHDKFQFREDVSGRDRSKYLWGSAAYAFGGVLLRAFAESGWLADIRGVQRDVEGGGLVTGLPVHSFGTDRLGVAIKTSTDVVVTDQLERDLSELGFMALCDCKDTEFSAFYSNPSIQQPKIYDRPGATTNAKLSAMLQYMLCVSRFAHYVKVLGRDKVGVFAETDELESFLQQWIVRYVTPDSEASAREKAKYPLREASVSVQGHPAKPGAYRCVMHLAPHYELDELAATVKVATELAPPRGM